MNTSEKIAALEALLVRVQKRAEAPRPKRERTAVFAAESAEAPPAAAQPVVEAPKVEAPKVAPIAAPVPPTTASKAGASPTGSYVAKGGMSEELPDFILEDEEEEEFDESQQDAALELEDGATSADSDAQELEIPSRPSVASLKAVNVRAPIELDTSSDGDIEIEHTPLASAVPSAVDEATARELERLPGISSLDADFELGPIASAATQSPAIPLAVSKPVIAPTPIAPAVPSPPAPPVVAAPVVAPPVVAPPVVAPPVVAPPVVAPPVVAAPVVAPPPTAAPVVAQSKPVVAAPIAPVVHEAASLPDAAVIVAEGAVAPPAPSTFVGMLRRSMALRVRS